MTGVLDTPPPATPDPARRSPTVTLTEVAERAGVSRATTARALGGYGSVSPAARDRVLAAAEELDLDRCAAYSDSHNDIPMLSLVGHPYAINPDTKLRKHAREHDWRLRDYRTGRKAVKIGIPAAAGVGATANTARASAVARLVAFPPAKAARNPG